MSEPSFRKMPVWQAAFDYSLAIHRLVGSLPEADRPPAARELEAVSLRMPVALARGSVTGKAGFVRTLHDVRQDCAEIQTLLDVLSELYPQSNLEELHNGIDELNNNLSVLIQRLSSASKPTPKTV